MVTITEITKYIANDGKEFDNYHDALTHERSLVDKVEERYNSFVKLSYSGHRLLEKYSLNHHAVWEVRGEDSNPDFSGPHHEPFLGNVEGTLEQAIRWAVAQERFVTWGAGGSIKLATNHEVIKL